LTRLWGRVVIPPMLRNVHRLAALALVLAGPLMAGAAGEVTVRADTSAQAVRDLRAWLAGPREKRAELAAAPFAAVALTRADADSATRALWLDHAAFIRATRAAEMHAKVIELGGLKMKFDLVRFNGPRTPPSGGCSLFLALHGGGGAPPEVNEAQWRNQLALAKGYHPREGLYLAPRAPTDAWNLWHQPHMDDFFDRLIQDLIVLENVNPNRMYIFGYSAGGDGVYQLAPRMADRWAGAAMMAGHPNDASPLGLRNLPFVIQVGANDAAYRRNAVAAKWGRELDALQQADTTGYPHFTKLHEGKGHWMDLQDRQAIPWMEKSSRVPLPDKVVWHQSPRTHRRFYWLAVPEARPGQDIVAQRTGQTVTLAATNTAAVTVLLNDAMVNLDQPVVVRGTGGPLFSNRVARTIATLGRTLAERGDTNLVFSAEVTVTLP